MNLLSLAPSRRSLVWFFLPSPVAASGLEFQADAAKVSRLRERTRIIRLGEDPHSLERLREREREEEDRWGRVSSDDQLDLDHSGGEEDDSEAEGEQSRGSTGRGTGKGWETKTRSR